MDTHLGTLRPNPQSAGHLQRRAWVTLVLTVLFLGLLGLADRGLPAEALEVFPECGQTLGPAAGTFRLGKSVGPCDGPEPALTIVGPYTLYMNGHRVFCVGPTEPTVPDGIRVIGDHVRIFGDADPAEFPPSVGGAFSCRTGVVLAGEGTHSLYGVIAAGNRDDGFRVESNNNRLLAQGSAHPLAVVNGKNGFNVLGNGNKLERTDARNNGKNGFFIDGEGNRLGYSNAFDNGRDPGPPPPGEGIRVLGSKTTIYSNVSMTNRGRDLVDVNPSCDQNNWNYNSGFANQPCVCPLNERKKASDPAMPCVVSVVCPCWSQGQLAGVGVTYGTPIVFWNDFPPFFASKALVETREGAEFGAFQVAQVDRFNAGADLSCSYFNFDFAPGAPEPITHGAEITTAEADVCQTEIDSQVSSLMSLGVVVECVGNLCP